jgi:hypothetical protein
MCLRPPERLPDSLFRKRAATEELTLRAAAEYGIRDQASRERVTRQDVQSWLELNDWYSEAKLRGESEYSAAFRQFKPTYEHQITYIRQLLEGKRPSKAYEALAVLAHEGHLGLLLTTNFDPLFENCYRSRYAHELSLRTLAKPEDYKHVTIDRDRRQLGYLHGNLDGYFGDDLFWGRHFVASNSRGNG